MVMLVVSVPPYEMETMAVLTMMLTMMLFTLLIGFDTLGLDRD